METESLYQEMGIMIDCVELMERKVLRKDVKWKKKMKPKKQDKKQCEENFSSSRVSLPVNASASTAFQLAAISNSS